MCHSWAKAVMKYVSPYSLFYPPLNRKAAKDLEKDTDKTREDT